MNKLIWLALTLALTACGGGGDGGSDDNNLHYDILPPDSKHKHPAFV